MKERIRPGDGLARGEIALFALCTAAYLVFCGIINFRGFEIFATPDMYSDTLIAKLMWEQKTIFPEGWVFGNQFYVLATPNLAALFYGLTGSLNLSMALATETMTALILAAFVWVLRPFCTARGIAAGVLAILAVVVCPSAPDHLSGQLFYLMASYYACYLIHVLLLCGVYLRLLTDRTRRVLTPSAALTLIVTLAMGMQSIRQTAVAVLPLVCVEILLRVLRRSDRRTTIFAALVFAANVLGLVLIRLLGVDNVSIYGGLTGTESSLLVNLKEDLLSFMGVTGLRSYQYGEIALCFYGLALIAAVCALPFFARRSPLFVAAGICALGAAAALGANIVVDLELRSIYLFTWFPLAAIAVVLLVERLGTAKPGLRAAGSLIVCTLAVFNLVTCYLPPAQRSLEDPDGIEERQLADFISESGYDYIYAQWYFGSRIAVRTDGAAIAGTWHDAPLEVLGYINPQNIYSEADNERAVYVVTADERPAFFERAEALGAELTMVAKAGQLEAFESSRQLMYLPS